MQKSDVGFLEYLRKFMHISYIELILPVAALPENGRSGKRLRSFLLKLASYITYPTEMRIR